MGARAETAAASADQPADVESAPVKGGLWRGPHQVGRHDRMDEPQQAQHGER
jgi:hypothetical protein